MISYRKVWPRASFPSPKLHAWQHAVLLRENRNPYRPGSRRWRDYEHHWYEAMARITPWEELRPHQRAAVARARTAYHRARGKAASHG